MIAYYQMRQMQARELHAAERPTSLLIAMQANQNRDPKKKKTPFSMEDFYLYQPMEDKNIPAGRYGAAALSLMKEGLFPHWALFCFKELTAAASEAIPAVRAYIGQDFILLAPLRDNEHMKGLLIARESATGPARRAVSPEGVEVFLDIPYVPTKIIATEDLSLRIA